MNFFKKHIAAAAAVIITVTSVLMPVSADAAFYERTGVPSVENLNYYNTNYNPFYTSNLWSWCTWYTYGRAREILGTEPKLCRGAASEWYNYNITNNAYPYSSNYYAARQGAVMCFKNRVAVVETVAEDGSPEYISGTGTSTLRTAEFNVEKWPASRPFYFGVPWGKEDFVGYIYITSDVSVSAPAQANPVAVGATETGYVTIESERLNVRSAPQIADNNIVGSLPPRSTVAIFPDKSINGWYYIKYGSLEGYVSGKYISLVQ